jgi:hypothetical protein
VLETGQTARAYYYVPNTDKYEYDDATPEEKTSTLWIEGSAIASVDESSGEASASVHTYAWAKQDGGIAEAEADAVYSCDWDWNGPPGTAPGGSLNWSHDGSGYASINGSNSAGDWQLSNMACGASASAHTSAYGTGASSSGTGSVSASVSDDDLASLSASGKNGVRH